MAKLPPAPAHAPPPQVAAVRRTPAFKVVKASPLDLPKLLEATAADGWQVVAIVADRGTNEHAAYLTR